MTEQGLPRRLKFNMHVGGHPPAYWAREAAMTEQGRPSLGRLSATRDGRRWEPSSLATDTFPWADLGVEPRFAGEETVACVAALSPGEYAETGRDEFQRYVNAAKGRGEVAIVVSIIGDQHSDGRSRHPLSTSDDSILLPGLDGRITARRLPKGAEARVAPNVGGADRDLALRLRNRGQDAPWWSVSLSSVAWAGIHGTDVRQPSGALHPLLVNDLEETLAGVWLPEDEPWRWYVVPGATDWQVVIRWLVDAALPEFVPASLQRVRAGEVVDDALLTSRELTARTALERFEADTTQERARLQAELEAAREAVAPTRIDLLYGTGKVLVAAVAAVIEEAGFSVEDLDETFGDGVSADLLISSAAGHWLVEVKSAAGNPSEGLVEDLDRHLRTWRGLGRPEALEGGLLVVNHQHKLPPGARDPLAYSRPEFVSSLRHLVIPTLSLFAWWRDSDMVAVAGAISGSSQIVNVPLARRGAAAPVVVADRADPISAGGAPGRRRFWQLKRGDSSPAEQ